MTRADPVFNPYPASMTNSVIPLLVRAAHLAKGIPALTPAAGRTAFAGDLYVDNMVNLNDAMKIERPNSWPQGRRYGSQWTHSDMKDVAFYFNFKFYEKVVERGELSGKAPYDAKAAYGAQVR